MPDKQLTVRQVREAHLWATYKKTKSEHDLSELLKHYHGLVVSVARSVRSTVPRHVDFEEMVCAGLYGLFQAVGAYRKKHGAGFVTFSSKRIRGAVLDYLRGLDMLPRGLRRRIAAEVSLRNWMAEAGEVPPTTDEICEHVGLPKGSYRMGMFPRTLHSIEGMRENKNTDDDDNHGIDGLRVTRDSTAEAIRYEDTIEAMERLLPARLARVLRMYFVDEFTMLEIGSVLKISEGTVCNDVARVKQILANYRYLFVNGQIETETK